MLTQEPRLFGEELLMQHHEPEPIQVEDDPDTEDENATTDEATFYVTPYDQDGNPVWSE